MKLRNKKTGAIKEIDEILIYHHNEEWHNFHSLAELNADWEDYTPKEPLIKDEKIRKIIRLWAEVNKSNKLFIGCDWNAIDEEDYMIEFADDNVFDFPIGTYTIAELCGEEE